MSVETERSAVRLILAKYPLTDDRRDRLARRIVDQPCTHCHARVSITDRSVRKVNGEYRVFHRGCERVGTITLRADARSPEAYARLRAARKAVDAAKRNMR